MTEKAPTEQSLTGRWKGYYTQHNHQRSIEADLTQAGQRLTGTMRDVETEFEFSVYELVAEGGLPPGADEQIISSLRQRYPGNANQPIRAVMTLPPDSTLEGRIRAQRVEFVKLYQGQAFSGFRMGEQRIGITQEASAVYYRGELNSDHDRIEGTWRINPTEDSQGAEGGFLLLRE